MKTYRIFFLLVMFFQFINFSFAQPNCQALYPTISQNGKYIYFSSNMETDFYQIFRCNIDGSNIIRITFSDKDDFYADESPDENWIVFQRGGYNSNAEIFILSLNTMQVSQLTNNNVYDGQPKFSPDSYKIVFTAWDESTYPEIFTMEIDGENRTQITADPGATWHSKPKFSPDGNYIYFAYGVNADNRIIKMTADGSTWKDITLPNDFGHDEADFDVFANGDKLVVQTTEYHGYNKGTDLIIINSDGTGWTKLTGGDDYEYFYSPCLNPNNSDNKIYFSYCKNINTNNNFTLKSMDFNGSNIKTIFECQVLSDEKVDTENPDVLFYPNPSSGKIFFSNNSLTGIKNIKIFSLSGTKVFEKTIIDDFNNVIDVSFLDNGVYIVTLEGDQFRIINKISIMINK